MSEITTAVETTKRKRAPKAEAPEAIKAAYLVWVGSEHYEDIAAWSDEAVAMGISKRLPNAAMGKALMEPGSVIFVAHDEGESTDCSKCLGTIECGDCRKRISDIQALTSAITKARESFKGDFATEASRGLHRFVEVRAKRAKELELACSSCTGCHGRGKMKGGTGGHVILADGRRWDYRTYNYWLHQPSKFRPEDLKKKEMCEGCGGTGLMPKAKIFGVFVPERIEYILKGDETEEELKRVKEFAHVTPGLLVTEAKRKCGVRKPGGVYAVTSVGGDKKARDAIASLLKRGILAPGGAELHGNFVRFLNPVPVPEKRFRGIKGIDIADVSAAAREAEMIRDAMEE